MICDYCGTEFEPQMGCSMVTCPKCGRIWL